MHILKQKIEQGKDIPLLSPDARDTLMEYAWPGNVSELNKAIEYAIEHLIEGKITRDSLPPLVVQQTPVPQDADKAKRDQTFGKQKALKSFLFKPLQELKTLQPSAKPAKGTG